MTEKKIINPVLDKMVDSNGIYNRRRKNIKLGDILRLRKRNFSYREIGLILGCTKQSIGKRLRDWEASKSKENKH